MLEKIAGKNGECQTKKQAPQARSAIKSADMRWALEAETWVFVIVI